MRRRLVAHEMAAWAPPEIEDAVTYLTRPSRALAPSAAPIRRANSSRDSVVLGCTRRISGTRGDSS